jgi:hypothetical protein
MKDEVKTAFASSSMSDEEKAFIHPSSFRLHPSECEVFMKTRRWKSVGRAARFVFAAALAGHAALSVGAHTTRAAHSAKPCVRETVVRARGVVTFGGYALNVSFTTEGRLVCFDITDADAKPSGPSA